MCHTPEFMSVFNVGVTLTCSLGGHTLSMIKVL